MDRYPACPAFFCVRRPRSESQLCICWPTSMECAATGRHDNLQCYVHRTLSPSGRRTTGFEELTLPEISTVTIRMSSEYKRNIILIFFFTVKPKTSSSCDLLTPGNMNFIWFLCIYGMTKSESMSQDPVSIHVYKNKKVIKEIKIKNI